MKNKVLAVLGLAATLGFGACKGSTNANTAVVNTTTTNMTVSTPMPVNKTMETAATDPNLKPNVEKALKAKGFNDVTVDTSTNPATLRGTVAKGKLPEVVQTATAANGGKPMVNQVQEK